MPKFAVILPAAGKSSRFGDARIKKPFIELSGRAIWLRAIEPFLNHDNVVQAIVVVSPDDLEWFREKFQANIAFMNIEVIAGGAERADSVNNGIQRLKPEVTHVAIHDAARPLIVKSWIDKIFATAIQSGAAVPASRIVSTVKRSQNGTVSETVSRENLWAAQTPQVFERKLLEKAIASHRGETVTDECQLIEATGHPVSIVECSPMNMKITTKEDLMMAKSLLGALPKEKGIRALHPFAEDNPHLLDGL